MRVESQQMYNNISLKSTTRCSDNIIHDVASSPTARNSNNTIEDCAQQVKYQTIDDARRDTAQHVRKQKRPSSNYFKQSSNGSSGERIKKQIQLTLIQEVNKNQPCSDVSTSENSQSQLQDQLSQMSLSKQLSQSNTKTQATRARQVPNIQDLPVFKRNFFKCLDVKESQCDTKEMDERFNNEMKPCKVSPQNVKLVKSLKLATEERLNQSDEANYRKNMAREYDNINSKQQMMPLSPSNGAQESRKRQDNVSPPQLPPSPISQQPTTIKNERQIKYLGLVIEKDDEYLIEVPSHNDGQDPMMIAPCDPVKRQYIPIRDLYIKIVKSCRQLSIESFEKRGNKDFKKTCKGLNKMSRRQSLIYKKMMSTAGTRGISF